MDTGEAGPAGSRPPTLHAVGLANSAEQPLPVRTVARSISEWVARLGRVWVEGQVTQVNRRSGTAYLVLRDPVADMSLNVTCSRQVCDAVVPPLSEGDRVVVHGKPEFYAGRGTLSLKADRDPPGRRRRAARPARAAQGAAWPRRGCSPPTASGRCRSCRAASG